MIKWRFSFYLRDAECSEDLKLGEWIDSCDVFAADFLSAQKAVFIISMDNDNWDICVTEQDPDDFNPQFICENDDV